MKRVSSSIDTMNEMGDEEIEKEVENALQYLRCSKESNGPTLHDLLCSLVNKLLTERPRNAYEDLENIIRAIKNDVKIKSESHENPMTTDHVRMIKSMLTPDPEDHWRTRALQPPPWSEVTEQMLLLQRLAGIMIPEEVVLQLAVSIRRLQHGNPEILRARFWGRVAGRYWIVESELTDEGYKTRREEQEARAAEEAAARAATADESAELLENPETKLKPQVETLQIPHELPGTGVNRMVYWVSVTPGGKTWVALPDVTPEQITAARRGVCGLFTGDLAAQVRSWPAFPWSEAVLLRVQLARISAATHVAPAGFFKTRPRGQEPEDEDEDEDEDDEEEDDEEGVEREAKVNRRYMAPSSAAPLLHTAAWVHCNPHILQEQARVTWWNPDPDSQEASDEEEDETSDEAGGERGPKLLSPLSEDKADPPLAAGLTDCWTVRDVSGVLQASAVLVRSLIWPGAVTLVAGRRLEHIYIGWGVKTQSRHRCPPFPPTPAPEPADLVLTRDPTPADEAAAQENNEDDEEGEEEDESE